MLGEIAHGPFTTNAIQKLLALWSCDADDLERARNVMRCWGGEPITKRSRRDESTIY